ncbi:MAG: XRE family transcriptional regulator [Armatimonadia bacterium]
MAHIGERIRLARTRARLSLEELASKMNVTKQAISKYETGKMAPSSATLLELSAGLGVTLDFLLRPMDVQFEQLKFRKLSKLPAKDRKAIEADVQDYLERLLLLERIVYGDDNCPPFSGIRHLPVTALGDAEVAANRCREVLKLGIDPIANLTSVLDMWCIRVVPALAVQGFDAVSTWLDQDIAVIAVNSSEDIPGDRQRFSMAHELGHLVIGASPAVDEEKACNRFAEGFLFPREAVLLELGKSRTRLSLEELHRLKQLYGVSMQTVVFRALHCGVINEATARGLHIRLSQSKVGKAEPFAGYPRERSELGRLDRLVDIAVAEQLITVGRAMEFRA